MANLNATLNILTNWSPAVGTDTLTCFVNEHNNEGVQFEANGFNIENATVKCILASGAEKTVTIESGTGEATLIGEGFFITQIQISGITGGPFPVRFRQKAVF